MRVRVRLRVRVRFLAADLGCKAWVKYEVSAFGRFSDGFWLSWTAFRYRGRLLAIVDGVSPTAHTRFFFIFFLGAKRPKKKCMKQPNNAGRTSNNAGRT